MSKARDISKSTETLDVDGGTIKLDGNYPVGTNNVALGDTALDSNISGSENTAIGSQALTAATASELTAVGYRALGSNTSGARNVAVGRLAAYSTTTGGSSVSVGTGAAYSNTSGNYNTALGDLALFANTTASNNTAVGYQAGYSNTTGADQFFGGYFAGYATTTGTHNTGVGSSALRFNTTGNYNVALGVTALFSNTTASYNTAVGYQAGYSVTTAGENAFFGSQSGYAVTTGVQNSFIGEDAGSAVTTGSKNAILGSFTGNQGGLDIRTSSNNIVLSDGDGNPRVYVDANHNITLGSTGGLFGGSGGGASLNLTTSRNGAVYFITSDFDCLWVEQGKSGGGTAGTFARNSSGDLVRFKTTTAQVGTISTNGSTTSYNTSSDYRLKENVVELTGATDRLKQIPVHRFNFIADPNTTVDGFLAHEVQAIVPEAITGTKDEVDADGNPVYQGIDQSKLVPLLVATIKELEARITALEAK